MGLRRVHGPDRPEVECWVIARFPTTHMCPSSRRFLLSCVVCVLVFALILYNMCARESAPSCHPLWGAEGGDLPEDTWRLWSLDRYQVTLGPDTSGSEGDKSMSLLNPCCLVGPCVGPELCLLLGGLVQRHCCCQFPLPYPALDKNAANSQQVSSVSISSALVAFEASSNSFEDPCCIAGTCSPCL